MKGLRGFDVIGLFVICMYVVALSIVVSGRPATFLEDFRVTWADNHVRQLDGGRGIQLVLDQSSGNLFILYTQCHSKLFLGHYFFFFFWLDGPQFFINKSKLFRITTLLTKNPSI